MAKDFGPPGFEPTARDLPPREISALDLSATRAGGESFLRRLHRRFRARTDFENVLFGFSDANNPYLPSFTSVGHV